MRINQKKVQDDVQYSVTWKVINASITKGYCEKSDDIIPN
jgi:hypothetical protein